MLHFKLPALGETILKTLKGCTHLLSVNLMKDAKISCLVYQTSFRLVLSFFSDDSIETQRSDMMG